MRLDVVHFTLPAVKLKSIAILDKYRRSIMDWGKAFIKGDRFKFESVSLLNFNNGNHVERHFNDKSNGPTVALLPSSQ